MKFIETRGNDGVKPSHVSFSQAILSPSASFGGLYVPESLPALGGAFMQKHLQSSYKELAFDLLRAFEIDIEDAVIQEALDLYDRFDEPANPVPVVKIEEDLFVSELYHGPTRAFKDMALQPFGHILSYLAQKRGENYLILAATSGDTGPATLETFKNRPNIKVACLYPDGGTSDVQRLQMVTEEGKNLKVIGIHGDFDDAQNALKSLLASENFKNKLSQKQIKLSAANSVNFGRIIFQTIYHFHSYLELVRKKEIIMGDLVDLIIPSGNFGNALGAYYAKKMGLFVGKILIASNKNDILTQLITQGRYDLRDRRLIHTTSPAMDILKSSNVERILFDKFGPERTKELMEQLDAYHVYELTREELEVLRGDFDAAFSDDATVSEAIRTYARKGYLMDTHTATCLRPYRELSAKGRKKIAYSTAEWTKFSPTVLAALSGEEALCASSEEEKRVCSDEEALKEVSALFKVSIPPVIAELFKKHVVHDTVIDKERIEEEILAFI